MNEGGQNDIVIPVAEFGRQVFVDPERQRAFDEVGYVVLPLLEPDAVATLRDWYLDRAGDQGPNPPGAYNDTYAEFSVVHSYPEFRREAYDHICGVLAEPLSDVVEAYRPLVANYVNKPAGTGVVPTHQNWAVVDEAEFQSISVWVALVDCVVDNGAMYLMDGSHRHLRGPRGQWSYSAFLDVEESDAQTQMTPVCVMAGEAVILDDAVLHYSPPNQTDEARLAIQFVMVPDEAPAFYHHLASEADGIGVVETWAVTAPFFFDFWNDVGDPDYGELVRTFEAPRPRYRSDVLSALAGGDPIPLADPGPSTAVGADPVRAPDSQATNPESSGDEAGGSGASRVSAMSAGRQLRARVAARLRR